MSRRVARCTLALALLSSAPPRTTTAQQPLPAAVPWATGEFLEYDVKFGPLTSGSARMEVVGTDTIRGRTAWRLRFNVSGGFWPLRVNDWYDSWMDVETLNSLRFIQKLDEVGAKRYREYEIHPERAVFQLKGKEEATSVSDPLDDASFFYFVRSIPLHVGETYEFNRYFDPKANPVKIIVLRKERIRVRAGTFDCIVLQPVIKTSGLFSEGGEAEIWLSDDKRRILVQMKSKLSVGSLNLYLKRTRFGTDSTSIPGQR